MEKYSESLIKRDIKRLLGLNEENFSYYFKLGLIIKSTKKGKYHYALKMQNMILERGTVFKYYFEDSYQEELREFVDLVKHTSACKTWSKDEIVKLEKMLKKEKDPSEQKKMQERIKEIKEVLKIT